MTRTWVTAIALVGVMADAAAAQDAKTVIANASKAMGVDGLNSIHYYGVAENGNLGQNNNANQPWPTTAANDYVRAIDFTQSASRATWQTYAVPVTGGSAALAAGQQNITAQSPWAQLLEIYITPWGFLKAAATNTASVRAQTVDGKRYQAVTVTGSAKAPSGQPYRVVGYINSDNMVEKVQTWLDHEFYGDLLIDADYLYYREAANGLKFPARIVQRRAGWPTFEMYVLGANGNPANLQQLMTPPAGRGGAPGGPPGAATVAAPPQPPARRQVPRPPPRSWQKACSGSTAPITPWPWKWPTTSSSSSQGRRTSPGRARSSTRRSGSSRTSRSATA
jgi:hypothetical protein